MASLRFRNDKWQAQVRRYGHTPQTKSFQSKADAQRWSRHIEAELDRTLIPNDPRALSTITIAELLARCTNQRTQRFTNAVPLHCLPVSLWHVLGALSSMGSGSC